MEAKDAKASYASEGKRRNTMVILTAGVMLSLTAVAWVITLVLMNSMNPMPSGMEKGKIELPIFSMSSMFTSPDPSMVFSFLSVWTFGMAAMMFPAMIPVISIYTTSVAKSEMRPVVAGVLGTALFLAGYLLLYVMLGAGVYALIYFAFYLAGFIPALATYALPAASGILIAAGIWQVTPLKDACLSKCVSPFGFFLLHAKKGLGGAFRMGAEHGYYCVGCCWMYMLVMLGVGAMSIPSMVLLASLITVEKAIVRGASWFRWVSAAIFIILGGALVLLPQLFVP